MLLFLVIKSDLTKAAVHYTGSSPYKISGCYIQWRWCLSHLWSL